MNVLKLRSYPARTILFAAFAFSLVPVIFINLKFNQILPLKSWDLYLSLKCTAAILSAGIAQIILNRWGSSRGKNFKLLLNLAAVLIFAAAVWLLYSKVLQARWWALDDHEIMALIGSKGTISFGELITSLSQTEIALFGTYPRFRPIYWLLRILEAIFWGQNAQLWFAMRLIYFTVFLFLFWKILSFFIDYWNAVLITLLLAVNPFWLEIVSRLGPSETYASIGLALTFLGFIPLMISLRQNRTSRLLDWLVFSTGLILSVGSKENMLFLGIFLLYALIIAWQNGEKKRTILFGALNGGMFLLVTAAVFLSTSKTGTDIHSIPTDLPSRLRDLAAFLGSDITLSLILSAGIFLIINWVYFKIKVPESQEFSRILLRYFIVFICTLWLLLSQKVFYFGEWPTASRYAFPGLLFIPVLFAGNLFFFQKVVVDQKFFSNLGRFFLSCVISILIIYHGINPIQKSVSQQVERTLTFSSLIDRISSVIKSSPETEVVIGSANALEYETIFSIIRFIRVRGLDNPVFLDYSTNPTNSQVEPLHSYLIDYSKSGSYKQIFINDWEYWQGVGKQRLRPLKDFVEDKPCVLVNLSGSHQTFNQCTRID